MVPLFLAALLLVRGLPALLYRALLTAGRRVVAGLLQATSLPFLVAATAIGERARPDRRRRGRRAGRRRPAVGAVFPAAGLALLRRAGGRADLDSGILGRIGSRMR